MSGRVTERHTVSAWSALLGSCRSLALRIWRLSNATTTTLPYAICLSSRLSICDPCAHSHPHALTLTLSHTDCTLRCTARSTSHSHPLLHPRLQPTSLLSRAFPWPLYALLHISSPTGLRRFDSAASASFCAPFRTD